MANVDGEIRIKIKPEVDGKSLNSTMTKAAESSKMALQKEFKNLDSVVSKSLKSLNDDVQSLNNNALADIFKRASNAVDIFKNRLVEVEKADSIDTLTVKLYKLENSLSRQANNILKMKSAFDNLSKTKSMEETLIKDYGSLDKATEKMKQLVAEADALKKAFQAQGSPAVGPGVIGPMEEQMQKIQQLKAELIDLKKTRQEMDTLSSKGTPEWTSAMENLDRVIKTTTSDIGNMSREFYKMGRDAGWAGSNKDIMNTYEQAINMRDLYREAQNLSTALKEIGNNAGNANQVFSTLSGYTEQFEKCVQAINDLAEEANKANSEVKNIGNSAKDIGFNFNNLRVAAFSFYRVLGSITTVGSDIVRSARRIYNFYMKIWNAAKKVLSVFTGIGKAIRGTADEHAKSFKKMLRDIFRYTFGIRSLFMLFRRLRKYIKEAFEAMAAQIPAVNTMLASLKSSLYALKGSLATAFEPILSAIAPALIRLIDLLAKAITYIGMFFAALTGRGFVYKANKVAQTIGDAAKNAKELNKQLQGFDELNNLTTNQGGGGGGDTPLAQFEKVDVPKWIENLANKFKQLFNDIMEPIKNAWAKVGDYVVAAWKRAFYNVKELLSDIVRDFVKAWKSGIGEIIATRFFEIVGDIGNIIANIAEALRDAWNYNKNGLKIWTAILTIVDKILTGVRSITTDIVKWTKSINLTPAMTAFKDWLESLVPIAKVVMDILYDIWQDALKPILTWAFDGENSGIALFFKILKNFNESIDKSKLRENLDKIWEAVGRFGQTVGEGLLIFMNKMLTYLSDWINSDNFTQWCEKVAEFLDNIQPAEIAEDLEQVVRIIQNIAEWAWKAIKYVIDHKDQILDFLEYASEHLDTIAKIFIGGKLLMDIGRLALNIAVFAGSLKNLGLFAKAAGSATKSGGLLSSIGNMFKTASLEAELSGAGSLAAQVFLGDFAANIAAGGATAFATIAAGIVGGIGAAIAGYAAGNKLGELLFPDDKELYEQYAGFEGFARMMVDLWDAIKYSAEEAGKAISTAFNNAITWIKDKWKGISDWFKINVTTPISMMFSDAWQAIKDVWSSIKEFFKPLADFLLDLWEGTTKRIGQLFEGCWIMIQAVWKIVTNWFNTYVIQPLQTAWNNLILVLESAWNTASQFIQQVWNNLVNDIKQLLTNMYNWINVNIVQPLKTMWNTLCANIKQFWNDLVTNIKSIWNACVAWFNTNVIAPLQNAFNIACTAIKGFFNALWIDIKNGAKSAVNWILSRIENGINGMIDTVNKFFEMFNKAGAWAARITKQSWSGVSLINHVSIPKLAQGAVIPPNNEFLAVLGDQKRGTNIEAPLDTMVQAFNMANRGGNEEEIALLQEQNNLLRQLLQKEFGITENAIYRSVVNQDRIYRKSTGMSQFA